MNECFTEEKTHSSLSFALHLVSTFSMPGESVRGLGDGDECPGSSFSGVFQVRLRWIFKLKHLLGICEGKGEEQGWAEAVMLARQCFGGDSGASTIHQSGQTWKHLCFSLSLAASQWGRLQVSALGTDPEGADHG